MGINHLASASCKSSTACKVLGNGLKRPRPLDEISNSVKATPSIEIEHVRNVYDSIASHWHGTRYKAWPKVQAYIESKAPGTFFGDMGCGNGKNMPTCNKLGFSLGIDTSLPLISIAEQKHGLESAAADLIHLPIRDEVFDCVLCIAVLHHISSVTRRLEAIRECMRVLKVGGDALFYAWAMEQKLDDSAQNDDKQGYLKESPGVSGHRFAEPDVMVPWHLKLVEKADGYDKKADLEFHKGQVSAKHATVDHEKNSVVFQRYCHVYSRGELEDLAKKLEPHVKIEQVYFDTGNWAMTLRKISSF